MGRADRLSHTSWRDEFYLKSGSRRRPCSSILSWASCPQPRPASKQTSAVSAALRQVGEAAPPRPCPCPTTMCSLTAQGSPSSAQTTTVDDATFFKVQLGTVPPASSNANAGVICAGSSACSCPLWPQSCPMMSTTPLCATNSTQTSCAQ